MIIINLMDLIIKTWYKLRYSYGSITLQTDGKRVLNCNKVTVGHVLHTVSLYNEYSSVRELY